MLCLRLPNLATSDWAAVNYNCGFYLVHFLRVLRLSTLLYHEYGCIAFEASAQRWFVARSRSEAGGLYGLIGCRRKLPLRMGTNGERNGVWDVGVEAVGGGRQTPVDIMASLLSKASAARL